jgi:hypothetical protein
MSLGSFRLKMVAYLLCLEEVIGVCGLHFSWTFSFPLRYMMVLYELNEYFVLWMYLTIYLGS